MAVSLREYRAKIRSTQSTKKITRAMELIAASRIIKAQQHAAAAGPYARELTRAVSALATFSNIEHVLTTENPNAERAAILVIASDRGLAGAYASSVLKETEQLAERLRGEGKQVTYFLAGRKAEQYFNFRQREFEKSWTGFSDKPTYDDARVIGDELIARGARDETAEEAVDPAEAVDELYVVYTRFKSMLVQEPTAIRLFPLEIVEGEEAPDEAEALPLYEFEPSAAEVLEAVLPKYLYSRIYSCLLQAAASELAARQKAMKSATDNAQDLIEKYTRLANQARQAGITQEISEIVGGANALAEASASD
ncbi:F0F1 ATP synthase subunit gamma [Aeromicrobium duanguangcaii]|uniref:ATP synthase gamma chain n=1 Tax=Aeromicrobium duanguangcaii TaxID=2968086 RepID=A0ABY5KFA5_9ACTN|nr:F0F1 ATP synthase subunit gamma [Aeromicrobium duanguangcaii]MCD9154939.1 F0F1 ATP synthase subunit gamma [Aeromicrobium duanguangcaii]MCL3839020.1 F0F1 ATP synthase subunit gamma [Aeromicrobium duanguangcaii]UUI67656.1 F0F1 ATP synthase subunit gamma [Aeromicrobium duanguangcaii]